MRAFIIYTSILVLLTSCSSHSVNEAKKNVDVITVHEQNLILHISKPEGQNYMVYKKIEDIETVNTIMNVLQNVSWENAKVSMSREPDYKINTINLDPTVSYEPVTYAVWLTPMKDLLEIIIEGQSKYGKLSKQDSTTLLTIIETP
ncbi:MAG: hypothetical protein WDZ91_15265 [Paenibacillaceae bacterium]